MTHKFRIRKTMTLVELFNMGPSPTFFDRQLKILRKAAYEMGMKPCGETEKDKTVSFRLGLLVALTKARQVLCSTDSPPHSLRAKFDDERGGYSLADIASGSGEVCPGYRTEELLADLKSGHRPLVGSTRGFGEGSARILRGLFGSLDALDPDKEPAAGQPETKTEAERNAEALTYYRDVLRNIEARLAAAKNRLEVLFLLSVAATKSEFEEKLKARFSFDDKQAEAVSGLLGSILPDSLAESEEDHARISARIKVLDAPA